MILRRTICRAVLAASTVALLAAASSEAGDRPQDQFALAQSALNDGLHTFALKRFEKLEKLAGFKRADAAGLGAAKCRFHLGQYDEVVRLLSGYAKRHAGSTYVPRARFWLARAYLEKASSSAGGARRKGLLKKASALFLELVGGDYDRLLRADAEFFAARIAFESGRNEDAAKGMGKFLAAHGASPFVLEARIISGRSLFNLYRFEEAAKVLSPVIKSGSVPKLVLEARLVRAESFYFLKDWNRALADYRAAAKIAPKGSDELHTARYGAGWALYQKALSNTDAAGKKADLKAALAEFEPVAKLPISTKLGRSGTFKRGHVLFDLGRYDEAVKVLEDCTVSKLFPELHVQARYLIAKAHRGSGRHKQALGRLDEIEQYNKLGKVPADLLAAARQQRAQVLVEMGRQVDAAEANLRLAKQVSSPAEKAELYLMAAVTYLDAESLGKVRYTKAREIIDDILQTKKLASELPFTRIRYYLARSYHGAALAEAEKGGDPRMASELMRLALAEYEKVYKYHGSDRYARFAGEARAGILRSQGKPGEACKIYEGLIRSGSKKGPEAARLYLELARSYQAAGDAHKAIGPLELARAIEGVAPGIRGDILFLRALLLAEDGDAPAAEKAYAGYLAEFAAGAGAADAAFNRGILLAGLGRHDESVKSFDRAAELAGTDGVAERARLEAARSCFAAGDLPKASRRFAVVAKGKQAPAWEAELSLAGIETDSGKGKGALVRLDRILKEAPPGAEVARRAAELAGRIHMVGLGYERAEEMFRIASESDIAAVKIRGISGLADAAYARNRFDFAAEAYTSLYYVARDNALRERALRGAVRSLKRHLPSTPREGKPELLKRARKMAGLSKDIPWRTVTLKEITELEEAAGKR